MLTKLIKHEFKATSRILLPLYLVLAVFTIINRLNFNFDQLQESFPLLHGLILSGYVLSLIAMFVVTFVILIIRFYKNLTSEEGYLMFTLPVTPRQLINSKLLVASVWTVLSFIAVIVSLFFLVIFPGEMHEFLRVIKDVRENLTESFGSYGILFIIEIIIVVILSILNDLLKIYLSIAIGQLINGHKLIGSIGAYIGINIVIQIITTILLTIAGFAYQTYANPMDIPRSFFPIMILLLLLLNIVYYEVTNYLFKNKLNLE
ncbi:MAG: hypothetical protein GX306_10975 [Clostridiales bacterium]|jgi:hypothetical protein|nr:hypothetical protein [Clostridiales bacterium]